jgi:hypothetical protein
MRRGAWDERELGVQRRGARELAEGEEGPWFAAGPVHTGAAFSSGPAAKLFTGHLAASGADEQGVRIWGLEVASTARASADESGTTAAAARGWWSHGVERRWVQAQRDGDDAGRDAGTAGERTDVSRPIWLNSLTNRLHYSVAGCPHAPYHAPAFIRPPSLPPVGNETTQSCFPARHGLVQGPSGPGRWPVV